MYGKKICSTVGTVKGKQLSSEKVWCKNMKRIQVQTLHGKVQGKLLTDFDTHWVEYVSWPPKFLTDTSMDSETLPR